MSWRVLLSILTVTGLVSWWAGIELGEWLVQKAPDAISSTTGNKSKTSIPTLDANGRAYVAEPPQPRIDGSLGVPKEIVPSDWSIVAIDVDGVVRDSDEMIRIDVPKTEAELATQTLAAGGNELPKGPNDIATLDVASTNTQIPPPYPSTQKGSTPYALTPVPSTSTNKTAPPSAANSTTNTTSRSDNPKSGNDNKVSWQQALHTDIGRCSQFNFFDRPRCIEQVQRKYCGPNNAWGKIPDCPDLYRTNTNPGG
jgi:hypothetical protein